MLPGSAKGLTGGLSDSSWASSDSSVLYLYCTETLALRGGEAGASQCFSSFNLIHRVRNFCFWSFFYLWAGLKEPRQDRVDHFDADLSSPVEYLPRFRTGPTASFLHCVCTAPLHNSISSIIMPLGSGFFFIFLFLLWYFVPWFHSNL